MTNDRTGRRRQPVRKDRARQAWPAQKRYGGQAARFRGGSSRHDRSTSAPVIIIILCVGLLIGWYAPDWRALFAGPAPDDRIAPAERVVQRLPADTLSARFTFCHSGGGVNCVVDGDTFWFEGAKYRIADIDTPETHGPRCAAEGALGARATQRLQALMNDGPFSLESADRDRDRYGRMLRVVTRDGESIGAMLVDEGLARRWDGSRHPWC